MNNEPVAWINRDDYDGWLNWDKNTAMPINIPLYTHPAKTLTTKEIADVWFSLYKEAIPMMDVVILATFGEAILKKASEK